MPVVCSGLTRTLARASVELQWLWSALVQAYLMGMPAPRLIEEIIAARRGSGWDFFGQGGRTDRSHEYVITVREGGDGQKEVTVTYNGKPINLPARPRGDSSTRALVGWACKQVRTHAEQAAD